MYCKCGNIIPDIRIKLGYKTCVECSKEDKWGCHQVIFHKTGNTIEVIKDKELCEQVNAMAKRTAFGICKGMKSSGKKFKAIQEKKETEIETKPLQRIINRYKPDPAIYDFEGIGSKAMEILELFGIENAKIFLLDSVRNLKISPEQKKQIESIITYIKP